MKQSGLHINQDKVTPEIAAELLELCPFNGFDYAGGVLSFNASCRVCRICERRGPAGVVSFHEAEDDTGGIRKEDWKGVAVFAELEGGVLSPVVPELIGKARELAKVIDHPVIILLVGCPEFAMEDLEQEILSYGADVVYSYSHPELKEFRVLPYAAVFENFIQTTTPSSVLVGATNLGRSLAPRVAARFTTGLTADCTQLEMKDNTDLIQIRPAFGGNIMARIITPKHRPQFCTVRYKVFSPPSPTKPFGRVQSMEVKPEWLEDNTKVLEILEKEQELDISEAELIVACGRGIRSPQDLELVQQLAKTLGGQTACTRPLVESGWMDARHQIGLSGRTVKPKLILTLGISGAVQFAAGMGGSETIIAINSDPKAPIFNIADYGIVGDLYEILPILLEQIKARKTKEQGEVLQ